MSEIRSGSSSSSQSSSLTRRTTASSALLTPGSARRRCRSPGPLPTPCDTVCCASGGPVLVDRYAFERLLRELGIEH